ncbi:MAG: farnesyl diphosphate synthase, partial [Pseudomonadota bacterium]
MTPEENRALKASLTAAASRTEAALDALLPPAGEGAEGQLATAMRRGALAGGKRLRAFLVIEGAAMLGGPAAGADRTAAAVECLHAYSLVHDDLPCMDDDDLRRGLPTVHVEWDEATAVLAGDALQTIAFEILADPATHADGGVRAELCLSLAKTSGFHGMVGGQTLDIWAETAAPYDLDETARTQALKTGALIRFAAGAGAILAQADQAAKDALDAYACDLGSAFQIADDILDEEGDAEAAGKALGKDAASHKATFVSLLGLDGAKARAAELTERAISALDPFGAAADPLRLAAKFAIS